MKKFYRHTFEIRKDGRSELIHTLLINPEELGMDEPAKVTATQTLGGAYITDFGQGLPTVTLSGTTGYRKRVNTEGAETDGFEEFVNFRKNVYRRFITDPEPDSTLSWYNWEDDEYYDIQPTNFRLSRSKNQPLLYRYELKFTCIKKLMNASSRVSSNMAEPKTRAIAISLSTGISNINEFLNTLR
jgi:hypothetical protein